MVAATDKIISLDDFLGTSRKTYVFTAPTSGAKVRLQRLTHGQVNQFNQDFDDSGNRITRDIQDRMIAAGLVEPDVTVDQLREVVGGSTMLDEIYFQVATECGFIRDLREKPTVYIPVALDPADERILGERFTVVHEPRPAEETAGSDAGPLPAAG